MGRTAALVETVAGVLVDETGGVTTADEDRTAVVPGADAVDDMRPDEGETPEGVTTPDDGITVGTPTDGTPVAGGAGGMTVAVSEAGPLKGALAEDSTEETGGAS